MYLPLRSYYTVSASLILRETGKNEFLSGVERINILIENPAELGPFLFMQLGSIERDYIISISPKLLQQIISENHLLVRLYLAIAMSPVSVRKKIIPVIANRKKPELDLDVEPIREFCSQQGFPDLQFPSFQYPNISGNLQIVGDCLVTVLANNLAEPGSPSPAIEDVTLRTSICVFAEEIDSLSLFCRLIKEREESNFETCPKDILKYYIEQDEANANAQLWNRRAQLYKSFLSLSKEVQKKEYYGVRDWYRNEYEILPLWYKRFGHIIKVITGKRSFRSLFNDKTKKYKD
jgi:hypothetical protein